MKFRVYREITMLMYNFESRPKMQGTNYPYFKLILNEN